MTYSQTSRQRRTYILERRATAIVLGMAGVAGLIVSVALTPETLADIDKAKLLRKADGLTQGKVIAHTVLKEKRTKKNSSLTVAYTVNGAEFQTHARGYAALPESTPIGSSVDVQYVTSDPAISEIVSKGLRPERYSWLSFILMWGLSVFLLVLSAISYKHLVDVKNNAGKSV